MTDTHQKDTQMDLAGHFYSTIFCGSLKNSLMTNFLLYSIISVINTYIYPQLQKLRDFPTIWFNIHNVVRMEGWIFRDCCDVTVYSSWQAHAVCVVQINTWL